MSLLAPAPRSTDIAVVSAVPRVMVSGPLPPAMVSALDTVAELVPGPKVSVSEPPPRSMAALLTPPLNAMVSAPLPESRLSTVLRVAVLAALPN